jgi:hypothetical protein
MDRYGYPIACYLRGDPLPRTRFLNATLLAAAAVSTTAVSTTVSAEEASTTSAEEAVIRKGNYS